MPTPYFSNYHFNPHLRWVSATGKEQVWWKKLDGYGIVKDPMMNVRKTLTGAIGMDNMRSYRRAIMTDPISDLANATHSRGEQRAWNLLYPDGSVRTYSTNSAASRGTGNWSRMLDLSNAIQFSADGGSVDWPNWMTWTNKFNYEPVDPS